jgi:hypothetical protein
MKVPMPSTETTLGPASPAMVMVLPTRVAVVVAEAAEGQEQHSGEGDRQSTGHGLKHLGDPGAVASGETTPTGPVRPR